MPRPRSIGLNENLRHLVVLFAIKSILFGDFYAGDANFLFVYDDLDRLTQVTDPFSNIVGYAYDLPSQVRKRIVYPINGELIAFHHRDHLDGLKGASHHVVG